MLIGAGFFSWPAEFPSHHRPCLVLQMQRRRVAGHGYSQGCLSVSSVAGHAVCYAAFGQSSLLSGTIVKALSRLQRLSHIRGLIAQGKPFNPALLLLRWIGVGYSQVFWVLGLSGSDASGTLRILFLADILWANVWMFGLTKLLVDAPLISKYLTRFGWALLLLSLAGYALRHFLGQKSS